MRTVLALAALALPAAAEWVQFRSGPYEVYTDAGDRARATLVALEQFRHALGAMLGEADLTTDIPVRVLVFGNARDRAAHAVAEPVRRGRDRYYVLLVAREAPSVALKHALAQLFLETNTARMPASIERGLAALFSTLEVKGTHITVGRPPEKADRDWARMHLLATSPEYYGKLRVLLGNLRRGLDPGMTYRNAFGKSEAEVEAEVDRHFAAGKFETAPLSGRPLAEKDFYEKEVTPAMARLALADLLLPASRAAYGGMLREQVNVAESHEGLGLLALAEGQKDEAREHFRQAVDAGLESPRAYIEYARLEPDDAKAVAALQGALKLAPKLGEPHALRAARETEPQRKMHWLKQATANAPRQAAYWESLARASLDARDFAEAARAWRGAEQAAVEEKDRERYRQARAAVEGQRLDWEESERKRLAAEREREIRALKDQALAEVRALEGRYSEGAAPAGGPAVPWWDGPKLEGRAAGVLKQVDCLGKRFRLIIEGEDRKLTRLLIADPGQVVISGGGELTLRCGAQKPARRVVAGFVPKPDAKLATAGEVATLEFQ